MPSTFLKQVQLDAAAIQHAEILHQPVVLVALEGGEIGLAADHHAQDRLVVGELEVRDRPVGGQGSVPEAFDDGGEPLRA